MLDCSAEIPDGLQSHPISFMTAKDFVSTTTTMTPARKGSYVASMLPRCTMGWCTGKSQCQLVKLGHKFTR